MRIIDNIFYTNLDDNLTIFIENIKQKEVIDNNTIFVLYYDHKLYYHKYWKCCDCMVLKLVNNRFLQFSNGKYFEDTLLDYKKYFDDYDLLEKYIKFTYIKGNAYCELANKLVFIIIADAYLINSKPIVFNDLYYTVNEFIEEILTNYPELYKYDYSQIKFCHCEI